MATDNDELEGYDPKPGDERRDPASTEFLMQQVLKKGPTFKAASEADVLKEGKPTIFRGGIDEAGLVADAQAQLLSARGQIKAEEDRRKWEERLGNNGKKTERDR